MRINYWAKFEEQTHYHIYNRGINGESIFASDENQRYFLSKWKKFIHPYFDTIAYCLMPNHFHFLVRVKIATEEIREKIEKENTSKASQFTNNEINYNTFLEDQFKRLFSSYALAFNREQKRTGTLFQKRFKRIIVADERKLWYLLIYIHHNPIHHQFCQNYTDWKYSSYEVYKSDAATLIIREEVLSWLDGNDTQNAKKIFLKHHEDFKLDKKMMQVHLDVE